MNRALILSALLLGACGPEDKAETGLPEEPATTETGSTAPVDSSGEDSGAPETDTDSDSETDTEPETDTEIDTDTDTNSSELSEGPVDDYSKMACSLRDGAPVPLIATATEKEAGHALALPSETEVYEVSWSHEGDAWITIEVPDWEIEERVFMDEAVSYEILGGVEVEPLSELYLNGACPDSGQTDRAFKFHSWGAFTVRIDEGSPNPFRLVLLQVE